MLPYSPTCLENINTNFMCFSDALKTRLEGDDESDIHRKRAADLNVRVARSGPSSPKRLRSLSDFAVTGKSRALCTLRMDQSSASMSPTTLCSRASRSCSRSWITTDATVGIVYVDLNSILMKEGFSVQGCLVIRLSYLGDINPFRESSAGVQFFSLSTLDPSIFTTHKMLGFVEELAVHADPEYSWSDSFRTSRKSNEYRHLLLYKLSSQMSILVGKKVGVVIADSIVSLFQTSDSTCGFGGTGSADNALGTGCLLSHHNADGVVPRSVMALVCIPKKTNSSSFKLIGKVVPSLLHLAEYRGGRGLLHKNDFDRFCRSAEEGGVWTPWGGRINKATRLRGGPRRRARQASELRRR
ncbi:Aste57867_16055 [Aphanomyces stellatus]|uniref:Aste57867_16055 protein n=1 Tax=Aphanomyces stellatus TaxID=120398 RepID=A0A485L5X8_9STRA|nr:hypothetical protein As57867_015999 [Aphanomyces stellatus]VFT92839.1 Aste57867_16055 [Aphanomyces stellatus]